MNMDSSIDRIEQQFHQITDNNYNIQFLHNHCPPSQQLVSPQPQHRMHQRLLSQQQLELNEQIKNDRSNQIYFRGSDIPQDSSRNQLPHRDTPQIQTDIRQMNQQLRQSSNSNNNKKVEEFEEIKILQAKKNKNDKRTKAYYILATINNFLMIVTVVGIIAKTYYAMSEEADQFNIMIYCGPMILAMVIRVFKNTNDASPCFSLIQLFKTMGVVLRMALVITISIKVDGYISWSWNSAFWPFWCSLAVQGVLIIFTLVLLVWSLIMYCRKLYPFTFLLGGIWAFYVTYGFSITLTWIVISFADFLDRKSSENLNYSEEALKSLWVLIIYLAGVTVFTFTTRKTLPFWFERMLYSPAQLEPMEESDDQSEQSDGPKIKEKRFFTPKFIVTDLTCIYCKKQTILTGAYFRKSKASELRRAYQRVRRKARQAIKRNIRVQRRKTDDHLNSISAGILMSTSTIDLQKSGVDIFSQKNRRSMSTKISIEPVDFIPQIFCEREGNQHGSQFNEQDEKLTEIMSQRQENQQNMVEDNKLYPQTTKNGLKMLSKFNKTRKVREEKNPDLNISGYSVESVKSGNASRNAEIRFSFNNLQLEKHKNNKLASKIFDQNRKDNKIKKSKIQETKHKRIEAQKAQNLVNLVQQECCLCFNEKPNCVIMECGHGQICFGCGEKLIKASQACPLCRDEIKAVLQLDLGSIYSNTIQVKRCFFKEVEKSNLITQNIQNEIRESTETFMNNRSIGPVLASRNSRAVTPANEIEEEKSNNRGDGQIDIGKSDITSVVMSEDPFDLFSFRQKKSQAEVSSRRGFDEEEYQEMSQFGSKQSYRNQGNELKVDINRELKKIEDNRPVTVVGLKRIKFLDFDSIDVDDNTEKNK